MKVLTYLLWLLMLVTGSTGCSLLLGETSSEDATPTPEPIFLPLELQLKPTPTSSILLPTSVPVELQFIAESEPIVVPVSEWTPSADPEIAFLVDAVSEQNLMGYVQTLENFGTRNTFSETDRDDHGIGAARRWIFSEFQRVGGERMNVQYQDYSLTFEGKETVQRNIIATLPGASDDAGVLILMANYDTRVGDWLDYWSPAPGADDNGSGVAALLEIARLVSVLTWDQTIVFAALTAEEQGTFGSRYFVQQAITNNMQIDAAINNDMIGGRAGIPQSVRLFSAGPETSKARQLARYIDYVGRLYLPSFTIEMIDGLDREGRWGDQREFVFAGYPAVRLMESQEDLSIQNSARDTWSLIDYGYFRQIVQLNLATLASMACAPSPAAIAMPLPEPGTFQLAWVTQPGVSGYVVSVRPLGEERLPPFRFISAEQAGNVVLSGYQSQQGHAISIAAINERGCLGAFSSPEIIINPTS